MSLVRSRDRKINGFSIELSVSLTSLFPSDPCIAGEPILVLYLMRLEGIRELLG